MGFLAEIFMKLLRDIFTGINGRLSSKRIIGAICIIFSMFLCVMSFFFGDLRDIPPNVQVVSLQFLAAGSGMIAAGLLERGKTSS